MQNFGFFEIAWLVRQNRFGVIGPKIFSFGQVLCELAGTVSSRVEIYQPWVQTFFRRSVMGVVRFALHSGWFGGSDRKNFENLH